MAKKIDMCGRVFGRLTVIEEKGREENNGEVMWLCKCSCGSETIVMGGSLRSGRTTSCGCVHKERTIETHTIHGCASRSGKHPAYNSWDNMKQRCGNPGKKEYELYGARGIIYDPRWEDFSIFWEDMKDAWQEGLEIDRIDTNGNYCKENCRWTTAKINNRNRRTTLFITAWGETRSLGDWCEAFGLDYNRTYQRISRDKWPAETALAMAPKKKTNN